MKPRVWNRRPKLRHRLKLWWHRLWVRADEFHSTLDRDHDLMSGMCECEKHRYINDLIRRREIAHRRDDTPRVNKLI